MKDTSPMDWRTNNNKCPRSRTPHQWIKKDGGTEPDGQSVGSPR